MTGDATSKASYKLGIQMMSRYNDERAVATIRALLRGTELPPYS